MGAWFICAMCGEDCLLNSLTLFDNHYLCEKCLEKYEQEEKREREASKEKGSN